MGSSGQTEVEVGYRALGRLGLLVHPEGEISSSEWDTVLLEIKAHLPELRLMILCSDGRLTPTQRNAVTLLQQQHPFRIATFTDSPHTRGAMTALEWFGVQVDVFPTAELSLGLAKLGATTDEIRGVRMSMRQIQRDLSWRASSVRQLAIKSTKAKAG